MESQRCPICKTEVAASPRYPNYVCTQCVKRAVNKEGSRVAFGNTSFIGSGFEAAVLDAQDRVVLKNADPVCFIDGVECEAQEGRFGGIIVQPI